MDYTDKELATAYLTAYNKGVLKTHFVVINDKQLSTLLEDKSIIPSGAELVKATTGKPVWIYKSEEG